MDEPARKRRHTIGRSLAWIAALALLMAPIAWWFRDAQMMRYRAEAERARAMAEQARAEAEIRLARATTAIRDVVGDAAIEADRTELERLRAENAELKRRLAEAEAKEKP